MEQHLWLSGDKGETTPRTLSESDMVAFACRVGDYSRMHLDRHFAQEENRGRRVTHGLLGASYSLGSLSHEVPQIVGRSVANSYLRDYSVNYRDVMLVDDTLRTRWDVTAVEAESDNRQLIRSDFRIINQGNALVADGQLGLVCGPEMVETIEPWAQEQESIPSSILYLEDYCEGGQVGHTEARTVGESDVIDFCGQCGDWNPLFVDAVYAKRERYGQRVAPPMLVFNIIFAAWLRQWLRWPMPDEGFAGHIADRWRWYGPCYLGDTLHCRYKTLAVRRSRSRPGLGILTIGLQAINQREEVVLQGEALMMYPGRS